MCPNIPPGMTTAARCLRSTSCARTFSQPAMSAIVSLLSRSDELARDRVDACSIEPVAVVEGCRRPDDDVLVGDAEPAERDAGAARFGERLRHRRAKPARDVVLLDGENGARLVG